MPWEICMITILHSSLPHLRGIFFYSLLLRKQSRSHPLHGSQHFSGPVAPPYSGRTSLLRPVDVLPFEDVPKAIANYHVCIVKSTRLDSDIISRSTQMQLIMQYGVGLEAVTPLRSCGMKLWC